MSGASGKVMTEIPKFYVKSENASTGSFRYYRWWISPYNTTGFTLHPAFVQRGGTARDNIYIGSYEATAKINASGTLVLDSRSGEQPWTGYGGSDPKDGMFKLAFDGGTTAPAGQVVDLYVSSGSWANSNATGFLILKQTSGTFTDDEPLKTGGTAFATANTPAGNAGIVANINTFEAAGEALGDGYGAMNVWSYSAIRMLHLIEYANWGSQETVGLGIVSKGGGTGFAGEVTGFNSVDTNVNEYGTGSGTGSAGYTPASYRTMTDLWGNSWEWVTGYTSTNTEYQITKRNGTGSLSTHPLAAGSYESSAAVPLGADGYVYGYWTSLFHEDLLQYQFIANSVTGGSQSTYGTDYQYSHNPGTRVLLAGGPWHDGRNAGLGYLDASYAASTSYRSFGARLEFTGAATLNGAAPAAQYALNASAGNAPFAVAFTDTSTGAPGWWRWDFGDGTSSNDQNPTHTYTEPGTYTVNLTAYTLYGEDTASATVTVYSPPGANFTQNATIGNAPLAVAFTDTSTGNVTAWSWSFGDGETSSQQSPTHTYSTAGTYTVTLNASNPYGFSLNTTVISVLDPPVAGFTANTTVIPTGSAVAFTDASTGNVTAWSWSFGDGETSSQQSPVHTYSTAGTYTVTLNASNPYGFSISTQTDYIDVGHPPAADFTTNATGGNAPLTVQFTDTTENTPTSWVWTFGDGGTSTLQSPVHTYTAAGTYTVSLTATNAYGEDTETKTDHITVLTAPGASFTVNATEGNAPLTVAFTDTSTGDITGWAWTFGDGETSTAQSPSHTYAAPGTYTVTLNASNPYGYSLSTRTNLVTALPPPAASFTQNVTGGNAPLTVQFTDASTGNVTAWAWSFGDGQTSTQQSPVHTYAAAGTYTVSLNASNAYGYDLSTQTNLITVLTPPAAAFTANVTGGNAPLTVQFTDTSTGDIDDRHWDFGDGQTSTQPNPIHTYLEPGIYTVTLTVSNAYSEDTETKTGLITVLTPPAAAFSADLNRIPVGGTIQFTDASTGDITTWHWDFGDGETSNEQSPSHTYTAPGLYTVSLTVSNAYGSDTETKATYIDVGLPPVADFTPSATIGVVPAEITFTDSSANTPTSWLWDFGDGETSTAQSPTHTYTAAGTYTVSLTATNAYGEDGETKTDLLTIYDPVTANFTVDAEAGLAPLAVQFTDTSTGTPTSWLWNFGDGETSALQNPSHTYAAEGNYTVTLTASHPGDEDTETKTEYVKVFDPVTAAFTVNATLGLTPMTVQFTDTSTGTPTSWAWDFGDGATSTAQHPTHTYTEPGLYTVTLTAADGFIGENPPLASDTETQTGLIAAYDPLVPGFTATPRTGYIPLTVQFTDTSVGAPTAWPHLHGHRHLPRLPDGLPRRRRADRDPGRLHHRGLPVHRRLHSERHVGDRPDDSPVHQHHRHLGRHPDRLSLELRRRHNLERAEPDPRLHSAGNVRRLAHGLWYPDPEHPGHGWDRPRRDPPDRGVHRHPDLRHRPPDCPVHQHLLRHDELPLGLRRRHHQHPAEPIPHLHDPGHLHRHPDGHQPLRQHRLNEGRLRHRDPGAAGRRLLGLPAHRARPAARQVHRRLHKLPDLVVLGLRGRRDQHAAAPDPHLPGGGHLHRQPDRHQFRGQRHRDQNRSPDHLRRRRSGLHRPLPRER